MIIISKETAHKLNRDFGIPFGENGISMTGRGNGRHKYYLCECKRNMQSYQTLIAK